MKKSKEKQCEHWWIYTTIRTYCKKCGVTYDRLYDALRTIDEMQHQLAELDAKLNNLSRLKQLFGSEENSYEKI